MLLFVEDILMVFPLKAIDPLYRNTKLCSHLSQEKPCSYQSDDGFFVVILSGQNIYPHVSVKTIRAKHLHLYPTFTIHNSEMM